MPPGESREDESVSNVSVRPSKCELCEEALNMAWQDAT